MKRLRVLLDVDGVICNSISPMVACVNAITEHSYTEDDVTDWSFQASLAITPAQEQEAEGLMLLHHFPEYPGGVEAVRDIMEVHDVVFVTSPHPRLREWGYWRNEWLEARFPKCRIVTTRHKDEVSGDVLVDDKAQNLVEWIRANPGSHGVLWSRPWNHQERAYDGYSGARFCRMGSWAMLQGFLKGLSRG